MQLNSPTNPWKIFGAAKGARSFQCHSLGFNFKRQKGSGARFRARLGFSLFTSKDLSLTMIQAKKQGKDIPVQGCAAPSAVEGLGLKEFLPKDCEEELDDLCFQQKLYTRGKTTVNHQECLHCVSKNMKLGWVAETCLGEAHKYCSQQSNREMYMEDRKAVAAGLQKADIADQGYRRRLREKKSGAAHKRKALLSSGALDLSECSVDVKFKCSDQQRNRIFEKAKVWVYGKVQPVNSAYHLAVNSGFNSPDLIYQSSWWHSIVPTRSHRISKRNHNKMATGSIYSGNAIFPPFYSTKVDKLLILMNGHAVEFAVNSSHRGPLVQLVNSAETVYALHTPHHRFDLLTQKNKPALCEGMALSVGSKEQRAGVQMRMGLLIAAHEALGAAAAQSGLDSTLGTDVVTFCTQRQQSQNSALLANTNHIVAQGLGMSRQHRMANMGSGVLDWPINTAASEQNGGTESEHDLFVPAQVFVQGVPSQKDSDNWQLALESSEEASEDFVYDSVWWQTTCPKSNKRNHIHSPFYEVTVTKLKIEINGFIRYFQLPTVMRDKLTLKQLVNSVGILSDSSDVEGQHNPWELFSDQTSPLVCRALGFNFNDAHSKTKVRIGMPVLPIGETRKSKGETHVPTRRLVDDGSVDDISISGGVEDYGWAHITGDHKHGTYFNGKIRQTDMIHTADEENSAQPEHVIAESDCQYAKSVVGIGISGDGGSLGSGMLDDTNDFRYKFAGAKIWVSGTAKPASSNYQNQWHLALRSQVDNDELSYDSEWWRRPVHVIKKLRKQNLATENLLTPAFVNVPVNKILIVMDGDAIEVAVKAGASLYDLVNDQKGIIAAREDFILGGKSKAVDTIKSDHQLLWGSLASVNATGGSNNPKFLCSPLTFNCWFTDDGKCDPNRWAQADGTLARLGFSMADKNPSAAAKRKKAMLNFDRFNYDVPPSQRFCMDIAGIGLAAHSRHSAPNSKSSDDDRSEVALDTLGSGLMRFKNKKSYFRPAEVYVFGHPRPHAGLKKVEAALNTKLTEADGASTSLASPVVSVADAKTYKGDNWQLAVLIQEKGSELGYDSSWWADEQEPIYSTDNAGIGKGYRSSKNGKNRMAGGYSQVLVRKVMIEINGVHKIVKIPAAAAGKLTLKQLVLSGGLLTEDNLGRLGCENTGGGGGGKSWYPQAILPWHLGSVPCHPLGLNYYFKQSTTTTKANAARVRIGYTLEEGNGAVGVGLQSSVAGLAKRIFSLDAGVISNGKSTFTPAIVWVQGDPVIRKKSRYKLAVASLDPGNDLAFHSSWWRTKTAKQHGNNKITEQYYTDSAEAMLLIMNGVAVEYNLRGSTVEVVDNKEAPLPLPVGYTTTGLPLNGLRTLRELALGVTRTKNGLGVVYYDEATKLQHEIVQDPWHVLRRQSGMQAAKSVCQQLQFNLQYSHSHQIVKARIGVVVSTFGGQGSMKCSILGGIVEGLGLLSGLPSVVSHGASSKNSGATGDDDSTTGEDVSAESSGMVGAATQRQEFLPATVYVQAKEASKKIHSKIRMVQIKHHKRPVT